MNKLYRRTGEFIRQLHEISLREKTNDFKVFWQKCGYKKDNTIPHENWINATCPVRWGGGEEHRWFRIEMMLKPEFIGRRIVVSPFPCDGIGEAMNAQFLVYIDGKMYCGLDLFHRGLEFTYNCSTVIDLYAYTGLCTREMIFWPWCAAIDEETRALEYDLFVPYETLGFTPENTREYSEIEGVLTKAVNALDLTNTDSENFKSSVASARKIVAEAYGESSIRASTTFIGHTHIDVAWLWSLEQTQEKVQRSFSTILQLMREYPEFKFMSSQPQLYEYFHKHASEELWQELKERVAEGRWETEGGMWLEADCNLISGESIVRQLLYGKKYFKENFGKDSKILWLPDAFGYTAALPQILKKSGIEWFVTSKISWNDTNRMPHDLFKWRGVDGSEINSYFLTAQDKIKGREPETFTTYNGEASPKQAVGTWERFSDKNLTSEVLHTFGYGDGGGGPTIEQLEYLRRMGKGVLGCVDVNIDTAKSYFDRLSKKIKDKKLSVWEGDLYLEYHRGTYTSQAKNKAYNRRSEFALSSLELASCIASVLNNVNYPHAQIDELWKTVLLNQFHDILPGSGIAEIYKTSEEQYKKLFVDIERLRNKMLSVIGVEEKVGYAVLNDNGFDLNAEMKLPNGKWTYVENIPSKGYRNFKELAEVTENSVMINGRVMENCFYRIKFDENYEIEEIFDKRNNRQVIPYGERANKLVVYDDHGNYEFDAWEIKSFYTEKSWNITDFESVEMVNDGCRKGIRIRRKFDKSTFEQTIYLYDKTERIDVENNFDVQNSRIIVKAEFPIDVHTNEATYDIQFGNIKRSTHFNTSWDEARFESYAHKYVDLSEGDYGVSIINDGKYGHDIHNGVIKLTLLKTAVYPDEQADIGNHSFKYAIYPHSGVCGVKTVQESYKFNNPPFVVTTLKGKEFSFVKCSSPQVMIDTVKKAEDGNGYIFRLYEYANTRAEVDLRFGFPIAKAEICNLMEEKIFDIKCKDNYVTLNIKPFEIISLRVLANEKLGV